MKFAILGTGAVGLFWACVLQRAGHDVSLHSRSKVDEYTALEFISGLFGKSWRGEAVSFNDAQRLAESDAVFIAVKTAGLLWVAQQLGQHGPSADTPFIYATNGIPWWFKLHYGLLTPDVEAFSCLPYNDWRVVISYVNTERIAKAVKHHAGLRLQLSRIADHTQESLVRALIKSGFSVELVENMEVTMWEKLAGNAVIGPLCVTHLCETGKIFESQVLIDTARHCMDEVKSVAHQCGIRELASSQSVLRSLKKISSFEPSMLRDARLGIETEYEELVGVVLLLAKNLGLNIPMLTRLHATCEASINAQKRCLSRV